MKICHFSDWHWDWKSLPAADLYVCTGDMYDNYPVGGRYWDINRAVEERGQAKAADAMADRIPGIFKNAPDAPLLIVRGNHDFIDLSRVFAKCKNLVHEFRDNEIIEILGLKVTGHRGIPAIDGSWSDEESRIDLAIKMRAMPHADLYLTHYPPSGILDSSLPPGTDQRGAMNYGLEGMGDFLLYRATKALHCFGHIHEWGGSVMSHGDVFFSNAACKTNLLDWTP